ncbi:MAG: pteridine-dependent deoxygenase [Pseudoxanthomonas sp.]|jgi:chorismate lyase/3-hydroxybenzoate synthase|uniref:chorismate transformation enzyme, FkbO/Hyg5 family n=1 Tax=Pseudoxanthomonas TaxID=83618 RepID=UPI001389A86F|nr:MULTISPECIES: pteridine-dependent deoxygenase [Pseudoxanthomonas]KAF1723703.1 pteridine-dependent deoxygenase [Pseudoxanthomonas mexicana]MCH2090705.1 pteridine-dependent deoxygenase [Pseudoxanthomonas sp.]
MSSAPDLSPAPQRLAVDYIHAPGPQALLGMSETLAVFGFGALAPSSAAIDDPRYLHVPLSPLREAAAPYEVWRSAGPVATGREGAIRYSHDGALMFGVLEWEEPDGGILHASAHAYAALVAFWRDSDYPHLLRIWNYFDAITLGEGDGERYRQFCVGRVQGLGDVDTRTLPAATAIGSRDGRRVLQVYWLAAREPGLPLENPRQVSAYRYPREYGPQSPTFARALLPPSPRVPLLLSGTASIVGHASQHADSLRAQLDETLTNLDSLLGAARERAPTLSPHLDGTSRLKVYVRDAADADAVAAQLEARLGTRVPWLMLHADVCRRELLVEIEGMHGVGA